MPLSKEQLLAPRYKVIADYPKSVHPVGTIINAGGQSQDLLYCDWDGPRCRQYPHLFKPMEWWEERKPEDMPEYVRHEHGVFKCRFDMNDTSRYFMYLPDECVLPYSPVSFQPATLEEYTQYINSKQ